MAVSNQSLKGTKKLREVCVLLRCKEEVRLVPLLDRLILRLCVSLAEERETEREGEINRSIISIETLGKINL